MLLPLDRPKDPIVGHLISRTTAGLTALRAYLVNEALHWAWCWTTLCAMTVRAILSSLMPP